MGVDFSFKAHETFGVIFVLEVKKIQREEGPKERYSFLSLSRKLEIILLSGVSVLWNTPRGL